MPKPIKNMLLFKDSVTNTAQDGAVVDTPPWLVNDLKTRKLGYTLVGVLIFVVGAWAAFAPMDSAALAPGTVQVIGKRKPIQHLEGGIVSEILVVSGDFVNIDQPLIRLDATRDRAEMQIAQGRIYNSQAAVDRLVAEREDSSQVTFSPNLVDAASSDERAAAAISRETALFEVRLSDRSGEIAVLQAKRKGVLAITEAKREVEASLEKEITDLAELLVDGYVDKQRLRLLEREYAELLGQITDLEVAQQEITLEIAQLRKRFKTSVVDQLSLTLEELYDLERTYEAVADRVSRSTIRAPVSGDVIDLKVNSLGAVVKPGETLMDLVPTTDELFVEARISPMDIDRIRVGQAAEIRFAVFKDAYLISGTLNKVSPDRLIDEFSDIPYYEVEVLLEAKDLKLLEGMVLVPGMPAEVVIKTGQRTMLGYLTSPIKRIFSRSLTED